MESFYGHVRTALDAILIIMGVQNGHIQPVTKRLTLDERTAIRAGSVYVFEEAQSGIKRWTDGYRWTKSRVDGHFLIYKTLGALATPSSSPERPRESIDLFETPQVQGEFLCKRTFSMAMKDKIVHVICYYKEIEWNTLPCPSKLEPFIKYQVPPEYLDVTTYRLHKKNLNEEEKSRKRARGDGQLTPSYDYPSSSYSFGSRPSLDQYQKMLLNMVRPSSIPLLPPMPDISISTPMPDSTPMNLFNQNPEPKKADDLAQAALALTQLSALF